MKKLLFLALVVLLAAPAAFSSPAKPQIAFLPPAMVSPFYAAAIDGAKTVAKKYGYELKILAPDREDDSAGLLRIVEDMITLKVDAIALCGIDTETLVNAVKKANAVHIPVVFFNNTVPLPSGDVFAYVGYDQRKGGAQVAEYALSKVKGQINAAIIEGLPSSYTTERAGGFKDVAAKNQRIKIVASQPGDWEREKGMNAATNMLQAHPEINVIFGLSDEMAIGAGQAAKALGRKDLVIIGLDGNKNAIDEAVAGNITATCSTNPKGIGAEAIETVYKALNHKTSPKIINTPTIIIDKTNAK